MPDVHFRCVITKKRKKYRSIFIIHRRITFLYKKKKKSPRNDKFLPFEGEEKFGASIDQFFNRLQIYSGIFIGRSIGRESFRSAGNSLIASSNREQLKRARKIMFWPRRAAACVERAIFTRDTICFPRLAPRIVTFRISGRERTVSIKIDRRFFPSLSLFLSLLANKYARKMEAPCRKIIYRR